MAINYVDLSMEELRKIYDRCTRIEKSLKELKEAYLVQLKKVTELADRTDELLVQNEYKTQSVLLAARMKKKDWLFEFEGEREEENEM